MTDTERATIRAVVHQLELGEASDILDAPDRQQPPAEYEAAVRDLRWCRGQLQKLIRDWDTL